MKWADPSGLNDTFSISLGLAIESKLFSEVSVLFLGHTWIFSSSKFSKTETGEVWVSVPIAHGSSFLSQIVCFFFLFCFVFWPVSVVLWLLSLHPSPNGRLTLDRFSCSYFRTNLYLRIYVRMWWKAVINNPT